LWALFAVLPGTKATAAYRPLLVSPFDCSFFYIKILFAVAVAVMAHCTGTNRQDTSIVLSSYHYKVTLPKVLSVVIDGKSVSPTSSRELGSKFVLDKVVPLMA